MNNAEAIPRETDISFTIRLHFEENEYLAYDLHFYLQNGSYIYYYEGEYRLVSEGVKSILDEALSGLVYDNETQKWQKK